MNFKKPRILLFSILILFLLIVINISSLHPEKLPYFIFRPSFLVLMIVMHLSFVKKVNFCFLASQSLIAIGQVFQYYNPTDFMNIAMLFYIAGLLLFSFVVLKMIRKVNYKVIFNFLLLFLVPFLIIYLIVLDDKIDRFLSFTYGILIVCLLALIFYNYLKKHSLANKLLLIGFFIGIVSIIIISMNIYNVYNDSTLFFLVTFFGLLCDVIISIGIVLRQRSIEKLI